MFTLLSDWSCMIKSFGCSMLDTIVPPVIVQLFEEAILIRCTLRAVV